MTVDPLIVEARNMAAVRADAVTAAAMCAGHFDNYPTISLRVEGLHRGIELAKEQES